MKKEKLTIDTAEIQSILRDYYKQLYANKMENLEEMDKFLEKHNLQRLSQEEIENINRPITSTGIETVIKNLPTMGLSELMRMIIISVTFCLNKKKIPQELRCKKYTNQFSL